MRIIYRPRGTGKTRELIWMSHETGYTIVTNKHNYAKEIKHIADSIGVSIPDPMAIDFVLPGKYEGLKIKGILIDNVELVLGTIFRGLSIGAITMRKEE